MKAAVLFVLAVVAVTAGEAQPSVPSPSFQALWNTTVSRDFGSSDQVRVVASGPSNVSRILVGHAASSNASAALVLSALDASTGALSWRYENIKQSNYDNRAVIGACEHFAAVVTADSRVVLLDSVTGREHWSVNIEEGIEVIGTSVSCDTDQSSPIVVVSSGVGINAFSDGQATWFSEGLYNTVTIPYNGLILATTVGTTDSFFVAFDSLSGSVKVNVSANFMWLTDASLAAADGTVALIGNGMAMVLKAADGSTVTQVQTPLGFLGFDITVGGDGRFVVAATDLRTKTAASTLFGYDAAGSNTFNFTVAGSLSAPALAGPRGATVGVETDSGFIVIDSLTGKQVAKDGRGTDAGQTGRPAAIPSGNAIVFAWTGFAKGDAKLFAGRYGSSAVV